MYIERLMPLFETRSLAEHAAEPVVDVFDCRRVAWCLRSAGRDRPSLYEGSSKSARLQSPSEERTISSKRRKDTSLCLSTVQCFSWLNVCSGLVLLCSTGAVTFHLHHAICARKVPHVLVFMLANTFCTLTLLFLLFNQLGVNCRITSAKLRCRREIVHGAINIIVLVTTARQLARISASRA